MSLTVYTFVDGVKFSDARGVVLVDSFNPHTLSFFNRKSIFDENMFQLTNNYNMNGFDCSYIFLSVH